MSLDAYDCKILKILADNCKISNIKLAKEIGLTPPTTLERVKKLQKNGYIVAYQAKLNYKKLGRGLSCIVAVNLKHQMDRKTIEPFEKMLRSLNEIEEFQLVTGRYDYIIKINLGDMDELKSFLFEKLIKDDYINKVETFMVVSSISKIDPSFIIETE